MSASPTLTAELWQLYLRLQTSVAYPPTTTVFHVSEEAVESVVGFYRRLRGSLGLESPRTLIIGPGGVNEVEAIRRSGNGELHVLTAHEEEASHLSGCTVHVADIHDMPFRSGMFHLLYSSNVLEHVFAPYIALMECRRVLCLKGRAYFIVPSFFGPEGGRGPYHLHCLDGLVWEELLCKTGFAVIESQIYSHDDPDGQEAQRLGVSVLDLLNRSDKSKTFVERTGCEYYACFLCEAVTPLYPHDGILRDLMVFKG